MTAEISKSNFDFGTIFDHGIAALEVLSPGDAEPVRYASVFYSADTFAELGDMPDDQVVLSLAEDPVPATSELHGYDKLLTAGELRRLIWDGRYFNSPDGELQLDVFVQFRAATLQALLQAIP